MVGIATRAPKEWVKEFQDACDFLHIPYRLVDISRNEWKESLLGVDVLMWRIHLGDPTGMREARLKIPVAEGMGIRCFPSTLMANLYDDKIRQTFFFQSNNCPVPETFVSFDEKDALHYASVAKYPVVAKTYGGASSSGVSLVRDRTEAEHIIRSVFKLESRWVRACRSRARSALRPISDKLRLRHPFLTEWASGSNGAEKERYVYFQEFIETGGDVRVTTLGPDVVSAFSRRNRRNDFRASGSGLWESFSEESLPKEPCEIALRISREHGFSCMAYDFLSGKRGWLIGEISYTFLLNRVYTDALYERRDGKYYKKAPVPIGVLHVRAMIDSLASK